MRPLKDVLLCAAAGALCLGLIVALDVVTGVPFSYGVPLAALLMSIPYAFGVTRGRAARRAPRQAGASAHVASAAGRAGARVGDEEVEDAGDTPRPCAIHSVIFIGPNAGRVRPGVGTPTQNAA
jgi:hypothetical protein